MTAEQVYKFCRAYKLFYSGTWQIKWGANIPNMKPLIQVPERRYYYRIAQKLNDDQIHALFTLGYFHRPHAYVTDLATPDAFAAAIAFAARAENGRELLARDLYDLSKRLAKTDIDEWLYGEMLGRQRAAIPPCVQEIISGELSVDVACMLLLIPQEDWQYNWPQEMESRPSLSSGDRFVDRLRRVDQLLRLNRPGWRMLTHELSAEFWAQMNYPTLAPRQSERSLSVF